MSGLHWLDIVVVIFYFAMMVLVGAYYTKKIKTTDSYAVADRTLTMKIMIGTTVATCIGANAAFGQLGMALRMGISFVYAHSAWHIGWIALILMSKRLRASETASLPEFLHKRYGNTTKIIASIVTLVFLINATAAQTAAVGTIFTTFKLTNYQTGVIIGGVLIILYTVFGGLYAVAVTDTIQAILLVGGVAIAVPIIGFAQAGGISNVINNAPAHIWDWSHISFLEMLGWIVAYALAAGSHAAYSQRILAAKSVKTAYWGSIWSNTIAFVIGLIIAISVFAAPFIFPDMKNGELFVPTMIFTYFPPLAKGLVISALFGLVLSTADSFLLMVGTTTANDIYTIFKPTADKKFLLKIARIITVVAGLLCIVLALYGGSVLTLFKTGAAAYGAGMFFPLFLGCFWKKASALGVNVGMLTGCFLTILWNLVGLKAATGIDGVIVGAFTCLVLTVVLSLLAKPKDTVPAEAGAAAQ